MIAKVFWMFCARLYIIFCQFCASYLIWIFLYVVFVTSLHIRKPCFSKIYSLFSQHIIFNLYLNYFIIVFSNLLINFSSFLIWNFYFYRTILFRLYYFSIVSFNNINILRNEINNVISCCFLLAFYKFL